MKKRVLAVFLAFCMIASSCILFASAATGLKSGNYVDKRDSVGNVTKMTSGTDFAVDVKVSVKSAPQLDMGTTTINADNVDSILDFKQGSSSRSFKTYYAAYWNVSGTYNSSTNTATVSFTPKDANTLDVYRLTKDVDDDSVVDATNSTGPIPQSFYLISPTSIIVTNIEEIAKLHTVTMGVRFFGSNYDNLVASEIAVVDAIVERSTGAQTVATSSVSNIIYDLLPGDKVTLKAHLKDTADEKFYGFYCWVDGSGKVISKNPQLPTQTIGSDDLAYYATFVEIVNRHTINFKSNGHGKMIALKESATKIESREIFMEKAEVTSENAQISILEGKDFTFTFVPDEGYEVAKVVIDGSTNVASFKYVFSGNVWENIKTLIKATGSNRSLTEDDTKGIYTFKNVVANHTIEVTFQKKAVYEAPSGLDMPTMEAEGLTLATVSEAEGDGKKGDSTTVPAENGAAGSGSAVGGVVNPATGSGSAIAVFAVLSLAAGAAFVTMKKKDN